MTLNFNKPKKDETLMYGLRPCAKNHTDLQGRTVRRKSGACYACCCGLPPGMFNFDFGELPMQEYKYRTKYENDEQRYKAHIQRQIQWNKDNPDKFLAAQKRYNAKPERKKIISERQAKYYLKNKERINAKNRENYWKKKEQNDTISQTSQSNTISGMGSE